MMTRKELVEKIIQEFEGCKLHAYRDSAGVATIGIGTTIYPDQVKVEMGNVCTKLQAEAYLRHHLEVKVYPQVNKYFTGKLPSDQLYASVCSIVYNCGAGILTGESFTKAKNSMKLEDFASAFKKWNKIRVDGQLVVSKGLANRREKEVSYFTV